MEFICSGLKQMHTTYNDSIADLVPEQLQRRAHDNVSQIRSKPQEPLARFAALYLTESNSIEEGFTFRALANFRTVDGRGFLLLASRSDTVEGVT